MLLSFRSLAPTTVSVSPRKPAFHHPLKLHPWDAIKISATLDECTLSLPYFQTLLPPSSPGYILREQNYIDLELNNIHACCAGV